MVRKATIAILIALALGAAGVPSALAVSVSPAVVNIRSDGPTTFFLTFRGLNSDAMFAQDGFFCGEIDLVDQCVPGTIFGRLPPRNDISTTSGVAAFTDVVTVPPSVVRRAYQRAAEGGPSRFFYVRFFRKKTGGGGDSVPVLLRLGGKGAGLPLSLVDVRLRWRDPKAPHDARGIGRSIDRPVMAIPRGVPPPPFGAEIVYTGAGRLKGRWEVVLPGDSQPTIQDLVTEATLPLEERPLQRRYALLQRFDLILPPTGRLYLAGPDPRKIPGGTDGLHLILLRIEATDDPNADTDIDPSGTQRIVTTGGVAGFTLPVLRYYVGSGEDTLELAALTAADLQLVLPRNHATIAAAQPVTFSWMESKGATVYRLEVEGDDGPVLSAVLNPGVSTYSAPPWLKDRKGKPLRWRVVALGDEGKPIALSDWREFRIR